MSEQDSFEFEDDNDLWLSTLSKKTYSVGLNITGAVQGEPSSLIDEEFSDYEKVVKLENEIYNDVQARIEATYVSRPSKDDSESILYVSSIFADMWTVDTRSYDLEKLKAHYKATLWTEHHDSITGNAEWFGESDGVLFVIITATKPLLD